MKKLLALLLISGNAFAGATGGFTTNDNSGIVTPDVATGYVAFGSDRIAYAPDGQMMFCQHHFETTMKRSSCEDDKGKNAWTYMKDSVPRGRNFIGFRAVSGSYGARLVELYYK